MYFVKVKYDKQWSSILNISENQIGALHICSTSNLKGSNIPTRWNFVKVNLLYVIPNWNFADRRRADLPSDLI